VLRIYAEALDRLRVRLNMYLVLYELLYIKRLGNFHFTMKQTFTLAFILEMSVYHLHSFVYDYLIHDSFILIYYRLKSENFL